MMKQIMQFVLVTVVPKQTKQQGHEVPTLGITLDTLLPGIRN
jgi:hypothetical protein